MSDKATRPQLATDYITTPTLASALDLFYAQCRARNLSPFTLRRYTADLESWQAWRVARAYSVLLTDIGIDELREYLTYLLYEHVPHSANPQRRADNKIGCAPETVANIRKRIHTAWVFWGDEGMLSDAQRAFFVRGRIPSPNVPEQIRPTYSQEVLDALLSAAEHFQVPESTARDRAIIRLLFDTGMRVAELCSIDDEQVNLGEQRAIITGKGGKQRHIFWTSTAAEALDAYLAVRTGERGGPLFRSCGRGGVAHKGRGGRLSMQTVRDIFDRLAKRAEKELPTGAPIHALRHTFAHRFLDEGGDGLHLQQLLGHASSRTTERYVRENGTGLRRVYRRVLGD